MDNSFEKILNHSPKVKSNSFEKVDLGNGTYQYLANLILENGTKLSDVLHYLPYGIVDKTITGIGGTTLELKSPRNSIIVEPLRSIAASKASEDLENYLYIGSPFGQFKNRPNDYKIIEYLKNEKVEYKKILIVADSLPRLIRLLEDNFGRNIYTDYFLLIDEIDSFQGDSNFRKSLELCIDIYKNFNVQNRCLISATILNFTDPELRDESKTIIKYDEQIKRGITLVSTQTLELATSEKIRQLVANKPDEKILIACNSLDIIEFIRLDLINTFKVPASLIKILCSLSNRDAVGEYFAEISNSVLPGQINFMTSAYFTGVDINERYHSIAISTYRVPQTLLSNYKLRQIAGRCRKELLSETVIYSAPIIPHDGKYYNVDELFEIAEANLQGIKCYVRANSRNPLLADLLLKQLDNLIKISGAFGYKFVRENYDGALCYSYFNIDAFIENQRVRFDLFNDKYKFRTVLEEENNVTFVEYNSKRDKGIDSNKLTNERKKRIIEFTLEQLKDVDDLNYISELKRNIQSADVREKVISYYESLIEYLDPAEAWDKTKYFCEQRDKKEFNNYMESIYFHLLPSNDPFKLQVLNEFKIDQKYSRGDIQIKLIDIFTQNHKPIEALDTPINAIRILNCYLKTDRRGVDRIISGTNPKNLKAKNVDVSRDGVTYINFDEV